MQLVNGSDPSLRIGHEKSQMNLMLRGFPILVLAATFIGASFLLGKAEKPADELTLLPRLASRGNTGAEIQLGRAYQDGQYGLKQDDETAFIWLKKAADTGDAHAVSTLHFRSGSPALAD